MMKVYGVVRHRNARIRGSEVVLARATSAARARLVLQIRTTSGGGQSRIDRYAPERGKPEISLKRRGNKPEFEVKGLVTTRGISELEPLAPHIELGCKWSCAIPSLDLRDEVAVTKTRWPRKFDTSKYVRSEIGLDANEKPKADYSLPLQGCNVELTEVQIGGHAGRWWNLDSKRSVILTACQPTSR